MPPSNREICDLLQNQYDDTLIADYQNRIGVVSLAVKRYPDCTLILFEGSRNIPDWYSNLKFLMVYIANFGWVEQGFYTDMPAAIDSVLPYLQQDKPVFFGAHSRGGPHANIGTRLLINKGWKRENLHRVLFAPARCFDAAGAAILQGSPGTAYRNYGSELDQDWICCVPMHVLGAPYVNTDPWTLINQPAAEGDDWLLLKRHHLFLYRQSPQVQNA